MVLINKKMLMIIIIYFGTMALFFVEQYFPKNFVMHCL